jgi:hypothetical protein
MGTDLKKLSNRELNELMKQYAEVPVEDRNAVAVVAVEVNIPAMSRHIVLGAEFGESLVMIAMDSDETARHMTEAMNKAGENDELPTNVSYGMWDVIKLDKKGVDVYIEVQRRMRQEEREEQDLTDRILDEAQKMVRGEG